MERALYFQFMDKVIGEVKNSFFCSLCTYSLGLKEYMGKNERNSFALSFFYVPFFFTLLYGSGSKIMIKQFLNFYPLITVENESHDKAN